MSKASVKKLKGVIKKDLELIRRRYKEELEKKDVPKNNWLTDNFYLIEKEGRGVLASLRNVRAASEDSSGLPRAYSILFREVADGRLPEPERFAELLTEHSFSLEETELTALMLRAALVSRAAQGTLEDTPLLENAVRAVTAAGDIDFEDLFRRGNKTENLLHADSAYADSTEESKSFFRHTVARLAREQGITEEETAQQLLVQAKQNAVSITQLLAGKRPKSKTGWLTAEILLPFIACILTGICSGYWLLVPFLLLPYWEILRAFILFFSSRRVRPAVIPRVKLENGIPRKAQTVILVSTLLPGAQNIPAVKNHLRELYLTNNAGAVKVCLLADLKAAPSQTQSTDHADVEAAKRMIDELNAEYNRFMLFVRPRKYSKTQGEYTGYERKRGAITEFIRAVKGDSSGFFVIHGAVDDLCTTKYVMALDSDTGLTLDCVTELVAAALHPANRAVKNTESGCVENGYGIFIPAVEVDTDSGYKTAFSRIMAGVSGVSVYDMVAGERYQDLFGNSIFTGKGLIDTDAYYAVLDRIFPDETVLSHDILEGELLRTAFISNAQVTDGFPKTEFSYLGRLNRWVRGDWQNTVYLAGKVKTKDGKIKNPLGFVSKFKLFDNLRRSVTPVAAFLLILTSVFMPVPAARLVLILAVLSVTVNELFAAVFSLVHNGLNGLSALYYGKAAPDAVAKLQRAAVTLIMLPQTAFSCGDAVIRSLLRTFVTHKNMLSWVTAAQSEKLKSTAAAVLKTVPSVLAAVWLLLLSGGFGKLIALFFLADVPFSLLSGRAAEKNRRKPDYLTREKLIRYASDMWNFFLKYCNAENNYLPPDNVQETPVFRMATRTSPTNIGLMLIAVLAARDFSFIDSKEMYTRLKQSFDTIIRLERWNGNLLNWYDTVTLEPLSPRFVSSVDSGNFLCCLAALKQGLLEYANEYAPLHEIIKRIDGLQKSTDIAAFYSKKRNLFHIGFDLDSDTMMSSYYDLLMSEARMMSFYAVATRAVPKRHWAALSRTLSRCRRYSGPVSWTGTMFEYFMPYIFLPAPENTLINEALRYCVYCQRERAKGLEIPFGMSESGFYKFDAQMNYQYKAHGVKALALKRGLNSDVVVSPYSTFLCLPFAQKSALKNIEELERLGLTGECGFYEAADFTKERTEGQDFSVVRSYMSHHVGMSIAGISNAVNNGVMQKRFMRNPELLSGKSLLYEKIPVSAVIFKDEDLKETPERPQPVQTSERRFERISMLSPHVMLLSNGEWATEISDCGTGHSIYRSINVTRKSRDILSEPQGVFAVLRTGGRAIPFCRALCAEEMDFKAEFTEDAANFSVSDNGVQCKQSVSVHPRLPAELRRFSIRNNSRQELAGELLLYFEPSLSSERNELAHKAFSKLFLTGGFDRAGNIVLFKRNMRNGENPLFCAAGLLDGGKFSASLAREEVLSRPDGVFSLTDSAKTYTDSFGKIDVCSLLRIPVKLSPKTSREISFFLCAASSADEIYARVSALRKESERGYPAGAPAVFKADNMDGIVGFSVMPKLFYEVEKSRIQRNALHDNLGAQKDLWSCGISGDIPIVYVEINGENTVSHAVPYIRLHRKLRYAGVFTDLVIAFHAAAQTNADKIRDAIRTFVKKEYTTELLGTPSGVHMLNTAGVSQQAQTTLLAASAYVAPKSGEELMLPAVPCEKSTIVPAAPAKKRENGIEQNGYVIAEKPRLPWSYVLCNPSFGTLVGDSTLGYTYAVNARENKLTAWNNDTSYDNRGELLFLRTSGQVFDLLRGATAVFGGNRARYMALADVIKAEITVGVPHAGMKKTVLVELENSSDEEKRMEICYYTEPWMAVDRHGAGFVKSTFDGNALQLQNPWNSGVAGVMRLGMDSQGAFYTVSKKDFLAGKWDTRGSLPQANGCAAIGKRLILPPRRKTAIKFILSYGRFSESAEYIARHETPVLKSENSVQIHTPDDELNALFNNFLPNQIIGGRIYGRTGFYQCGGAYGFRDQLQDVLSVSLTEPQLLRRQLLRCAAAQFSEGDVLHWWHNLSENTGKLRGVRTRYSDDLLWLPYALSEYVRRTGDLAFLQTEISFLEGEPLSETEHERYFEANRGTQKATLLVHAEKAVERALQFGTHALLLIGGGDWNDGYNHVGLKGKGESVWLSQFAAMTLNGMAEVLNRLGDKSTANAYKTTAQKLIGAVDEFAWDGDRYIRAFYDDGTKMGANESKECKIDSLPQSFAVFCGMPDKARVRTALKTAFDSLVDQKNGVVRLFAPAFSGKDRRAGYVTAYPEGIRENGGQYTHAAVWLCMALFRAGMKEEGKIVLDILNPLKKYQTPETAAQYKTEPYYLCGDVYAAKGIAGRGGWSLYTGSAGWYYTLVLREILGIRQENGRLTVQPCLPAGWKGFTTEIQIGNAVISVAVLSDSPTCMTVDGTPVDHVPLDNCDHIVNLK